MEINKKFEEVLAQPNLIESFLSIDPQTLMALRTYVNGRIDYVDAEESMTYWYAASVLDEILGTTEVVKTANAVNVL